MLRWSSSIFNPEPARNDIQSEEWGTMSLDDSVNQLSNVIDPTTWNNSNFSLVNISVYSVFKWEQTQPWLFITTYKGSEL